MKITKSALKEMIREEFGKINNRIKEVDAGDMEDPGHHPLNPPVKPKASKFYADEMGSDSSMISVVGQEILKPYLQMSKVPLDYESVVQFLMKHNIDEKLAAKLAQSVEMSGGIPGTDKLTEAVINKIIKALE